MLKVVFDTNIFISALHWEGTPWEIYERWLEDEFHLATSKEILSELGRVLEEEFDWAAEEAQELCSLISKLAEPTIPKQKLHVITDDPEDNKILECALASQVDYIISGNKHLLKLGEYKDIQIITARQFLDLLVKTSSPSIKAE